MAPQMYIGAIDQGTTSTRFIIFNKAGQIISSEQREHRQIFPKEGWTEHDPLEIWERTKEVVGGALKKAKLRPADLAAVGITNQRETTIVWSRSTGQPLYNAVVWMDTRSDKICQELASQSPLGKDRFREKTGLPLVSYFAGTKLRWLLDNVPAVRDAAESGDALFGTVDSWLLWRLSGGPGKGQHLTDVTNASRTLLMNLATLDWDDELCAAFGVPRSMLPRIVSSSEVYFEASDPVLAGVPVAGVLGDQQAALFGQTCFDPGESKNTYGTGCFLLMNTGEAAVQSNSGLLTTVAYRLGDAKPVYALEGSVAIGGALVQWLRDNLGLIASAPEVESLATSVDDNGGIYFVPAFSGLYAPYWRDDARGVLVGMTRYVNKGHVARAVLESTAFQSRDVFAAMERDSGVQLTALKHVAHIRVDGGMVANNLLMQTQADLLGAPVVRPKAGLGVGLYSSVDELRANWEKERTWSPLMSTERKSAMLRCWSKAVDRTLGWLDDGDTGNSALSAATCPKVNAMVLLSLGAAAGAALGWALARR